MSSPSARGLWGSGRLYCRWPVVVVIIAIITRTPLDAIVNIDALAAAASYQHQAAEHEGSNENFNKGFTVSLPCQRSVPGWQRQLRRGLHLWQQGHWAFVCPDSPAVFPPGFQLLLPWQPHPRQQYREARQA